MSWISDFRTRFAKNIREHPQEYSQTKLRCIVVQPLLIYGLYLYYSGTLEKNTAILALTMYVTSFLIFFDFLWRGAKTNTRKYVGAFHDNFLTTLYIFLAGPKGAFVLFIFPFITVGNGFRFGIRNLLFSGLLGLIGLVLIVSLDVFGVNNRPIGVGVTLSHLLVTVYIGFLIRQRERISASRERVISGLRDVIGNQQDNAPLLNATLAIDELENMTKQVQTLVINQQQSAEDIAAIFEQSFKVLQSSSVEKLRQSLEQVVRKYSFSELEFDIWLRKYSGSVRGTEDEVEARYQQSADGKIAGLAELAPTDDDLIIADPSPLESPWVIVRPRSGQFSEDYLVRIQRIWQGLTPAVIAAFEMIQFVEREKKKGQIEAELRTAETVQRTLLPAQAQTLGKVSIAAHYRSASACGGDWWGTYELNPGRYLILVGDVTGHGVGSAIITATVKGFTDAILSVPGVSLDSYFKALNRQLYNTGAGFHCLTLFGLVIDENEQMIEYLNAGHPPPFCVLSSQDQPLTLNAGEGHILGFETELPNSIQLIRKPLKDIEKIVIYTDGLTEASSPTGKIYGEGRLNRLLVDVHSSAEANSARALCETISKNSADWIGDAEATDDVTIVVIEFLKPAFTRSTPLGADLVRTDFLE